MSRKSAFESPTQPVVIVFDGSIAVGAMKVPAQRRHVHRERAEVLDRVEMNEHIVPFT